MEELPEGSIAILDSSVRFAIGGPSNEKYQALERYVTRRDVTVRIPDRVAEGAIEDVHSALDVGDRAAVVEGRGSLSSLVDD